MAYFRPPNAARAGIAISQTPDPVPLFPSGIMPVTFDAHIASKTQLGVVSIGDNINVTEQGEISVDVLSGPTGPIGNTGPTGSIGPTGPSGSGQTSTGSWTPKLISGPGGSSITITNKCSHYVKIGELVFLTFDIEVSKISNGSNSSYVMLEGLPFKSMECETYSGSAIISYFSELNSPTTYVSGSVIQDSFACDLWHEKANVTALPRLEKSEIKVKSRLQGSIVYMSKE